MGRVGSRPIGSGSVLLVYIQVPPTWDSLSNTMTEWPSRRRWRAAARPAAPAPITATLQAVTGGMADGSNWICCNFWIKYLVCIYRN